LFIENISKISNKINESNGEICETALKMNDDLNFNDSTEMVENRIIDKVFYRLRMFFALIHSKTIQSLLERKVSCV